MQIIFVSREAALAQPVETDQTTVIKIDASKVGYMITVFSVQYIPFKPTQPVLCSAY